LRPPSLIPAIPFRLFSEQRICATKTKSAPTILHACAYADHWNAQTREIYALLDGIRTNEDIAHLLGLSALDVRRILSLFAIIGLVDLFDESTQSVLSFDTYTVRRAVDLLYFERDIFLTRFFQLLFQNSDYTMQESAAFFSFLQFVARGGTTTKPFFAVIQQAGQEHHVMSLTQEQCAAISLAFFVAAEHTLGSWWNGTRAHHLRNAFFLVTDTLFTQELTQQDFHHLLAVS